MALLWAIGLGLYVFLLMLGISVSTGVSLIVSLISGIIMFFVILLFGQDRPRA